MWKRINIIAVAAMLATGMVVTSAPAEDIYHQSFDNATGVNQASSSYHIRIFANTSGGQTAADLSDGAFVRAEDSIGTHQSNVNAPDPNDNASNGANGQPIGRWRIAGNVPQALIFTEFNSASFPIGEEGTPGNQPGPVDPDDWLNLAGSIKISHSTGAGSTRFAIRIGETFYVQQAGFPDGTFPTITVDLKEGESLWKELHFTENIELGMSSNPAVTLSSLSGPITAFGIYMNDVTNTIRTDTWTLTSNLIASPGHIGRLPHERYVGPPDAYTTFGIYGTPPESPDRSRILYTAFDASELSENDDLASASLYICNADLSNHRHLRDIEFPVRVHNGAFQQWVDDDSVAYSGGAHFAGDVYVINANTGQTEWGPYTGAMLGDNNYDETILINVWSPTSNVGPQGLYELDTRTGNLTLVVTTEEIADVYNDQWDDGSDDPQGWITAHAKFSTDGSHIAFTVSTNNLFDPHYGKYGNTRSKQHMFTLRRDGSDLRLWGIDKPMHFDWYDEDTLWGADIGVDDGFDDGGFRIMRRWNRDKEVVETLAGLGCHVAKSPDNKWFAGESWYQHDPVVMRLYPYGELQASDIIFDIPFAKVTWDSHVAHVNPSFGRDSKRLYYKRAVSEQLVQTFMVDINELHIDEVGPTPGDLDGDGFVGIADLSIVLAHWSQTVEPGDLLMGDISGDGFVGINDLNAILSNWNTGFVLPPAEDRDLSLGINLSKVTNDSREWVFVDAIKQSQPWVSTNPNGIPFDTGETVATDPDGWPLLSPGKAAQTTMFKDSNGAYPAGVYICTYEGTGDIHFQADASVANATPGRIEVNVVPTGAGILLRIAESDAGDPIHNIKLWMPGFEDAASSFHPLFIQRLSKFSVLRFRDWQLIDSPPAGITWQSRTLPSYYTQATPNGVAVEYMIELCNELGADPWFSTPHTASDTYVDSFAGLVFNGLDADRKVYLEWSNEVWNWRKATYGWVGVQSNAAPLTSGWYDFWAQKLSATFTSWEQAFTGQEGRLVRVASGQAANIWVTRNLTDRLAGQFDAVSCSGYFDDTDASFDADTTAQDVLDDAATRAIPQRSAVFYQDHGNLAQGLSQTLGRTIRFIGYEGGQRYAVDNRVLPYAQTFLDIQYLPKMFDVYLQNLDAFEQAGGDLMTVYNYVDRPDGNGAWGQLEHQDASLNISPKFKALMYYVGDQ